MLYTFLYLYTLLLHLHINVSLITFFDLLLKVTFPFIAGEHPSVFEMRNVFTKARMSSLKSGILFYPNQESRILV